MTIPPDDRTPHTLGYPSQPANLPPTAPNAPTPTPQSAWPAAVAVVLALAGGGGAWAIAGGSKPPHTTPVAASTTKAAAVPTTTPVSAPSTASVPARTVSIACSGAGIYPIALVDGKYDFKELWAAGSADCDSEPVTPATPIELEALRASGYDGDDIGTLFEICGQVDPHDVYLEKGFAMSPEQIKEMTGAIKICPDHPHAKAWRTAMKLGQADADLEAQGRMFGDGTYRVGKEIKAGTYVTRDVDGCYWERQNGSGETIANYFTNSAKRVVVTIRSSDYAFSTEGCGTWRPA